jgi:hypothetical protein
MTVADAAPAPLVRPWFRRARLWLILLAVIALGAVLVGTLSDEPRRPLDPSSAHKNGSKALVRLLERYGATVTDTRSLETALRAAPESAVVVVAPDEYADAQLHELSSAAARLVLAAPGARAAHAIASGLEPDPARPPLGAPSCSDPGATAAGRATLPGDTVGYRPGETGATSCYGGALLVTPRLAVLGSASLLRNDQVGRRGVAALDINAITDSRRIDSVVWLQPGADTAGSGSTSIWELFPPGAYRVFWWALVVGALVTVWRARRLGGVVSEPLPVAVRSVEVVEGHGRLYARAGARDRAAAALRSATANRIAHRLGLPRGAPAEQVGVAAAPLAGRPPAQLGALLAGAAPADDTGLMQLARDLDTLEAALGGAREGKP